MTVPTFLVAGAARAGTTALCEGLRTHPGVFLTDPKEPHYFALHGAAPTFSGPGDASTINRVAVTDLGAYLALYPDDASSYQALGDASVSTLYYAEAAIEEIKRIAPQARIVIVLREPVERAKSAFDYMRARGFEPETDFLTAVRDEERRIAEGWHHLWHYSRMSLYADSVSRFLDAFGPEQVRVWFYDDLQSDYERTVREVLRFIGTTESPGEAAGVPRVNVSGVPRSRAVQGAVQLATRTDVLRRFVKRFTSFRMREAVRSRLLKRGGVSEPERRALAPVFEADLARLRQLLSPEHAPDWLAPAP